jgi:hypothetical protein
MNFDVSEDVSVYNLNPSLPLLEKTVYRITPLLSNSPMDIIAECIDVEISNVYNSFVILNITESDGSINVGDRVRWRRDWFTYSKLNKNKYPEYFL